MTYSAASADTVRLSLTDRMSRTNRLAGAWWPASLDLDLELLPLLRTVGTVTGNIQGVMLNRSEWPETPINWLPNMMPRLRISWYGRQDPNTIVLVGRGERLGLLVVPPGTDSATAARAMRMASVKGNALSGADILATVAR